MEEINRITGQIVDAAYHIYSTLGPGLYEEVYGEILVHQLRKRGLRVDCGHPVPVLFEGLRFDKAYRVDMLVEGRVVVELKSLDKLNRANIRQTLTYLRLLNAPLALLINFGAPSFAEAVQRLANFA